MSYTSSDYQVSFDLRDMLKREQGLHHALQVFQKAVENSGSDSSQQLNLGICLFELMRFEESEGVLGSLCQNGILQDLPEHWASIALKYYSRCIFERDKNAGVHSIIDRIDWFGHQVQIELASFTLEHLCSIYNIEMCQQLIASIREPHLLSPKAVRKFYEVSSAANTLEDFFDRQNSFKGEGLKDELSLISLIYMNQSNHTWRETLKSIIFSGRAFGEFDAFRLGLQAIHRLSRSDASDFFATLARDPSNAVVCARLRGILAEKHGNVDTAISHYHEAAMRELEAQDLETGAIQLRSLSDVKVSCIALSFNDSSLVEEYCDSVIPHCDQIIVNDGGSTDDTVIYFENISKHRGFPIKVIRDHQTGFRERSVHTKDGYRKAGLGGVDGFQADRRRTSTLIAADHEYILLADLDDRFPRYPNMKSLVASAYGIDHFIGSKCEMLDESTFCDLYQSPDSALPTLFKRHPKHIFSGMSAADEYLARVDLDIGRRASEAMRLRLTRCYYFRHMKFLLDPTYKKASEKHLGPKYCVSGRDW